MESKTTPASGSFIIKLGEVVFDQTAKNGEDSSNRLKIRTAMDKNKSDKDLPYAFPLMPKVIQVRPKVGECALVICSELDQPNSNRYYIGPVISEYQRFYDDPFFNGLGTAASKLENPPKDYDRNKSLARLDEINNTEGAFPEYEDVAVIGRKNGDLIIKDDEIDLRCGIREKMINTGKDKDKESTDGYISFNPNNPAFLQLLFSDQALMRLKSNHGINGQDTVNSIVNVAGDKINIIGKNRDKAVIENYDSKELVSKENIKSMVESLHQLPHGDTLIAYLDLLRIAISKHIHTFPGRTAQNGEGHTEIDNIMNYDLESILSDDVRIS